MFCLPDANMKMKNFDDCFLQIFSNVLMAITLTTTYAAMEEEIVMTAVMKYSAQVR